MRIRDGKNSDPGQVKFGSEKIIPDPQPCEQYKKLQLLRIRIRTDKFGKPDPDPHQSEKSGAVKAHNGAVEAHHGAVEAHNRAVETHIRKSDPDLHQNDSQHCTELENMHKKS